MHRWTQLAVLIGMTAATVAAPSAGHAGPQPVAIASCGDSKLAVVAGTGGAAGELHATIAKGSERWTFTATLGLVRIGGKTRTLTVEDVVTKDRIPPRAKDATPSGLFVDLLLDDKKVLLRHSAEGGRDVEYAVDLEACSLPREADAALAALAPPPGEPAGCAAATVKATYRPQIDQAAKLAAEAADREAQALCDDHQKTIAARARVEQTISDRAARDRITARGAALLRSEDARVKAYARIDSCLGADPAGAKGVAALHDGEAKQRACYSQIAARP